MSPSGATFELATLAAQGGTTGDEVRNAGRRMILNAVALAVGASNGPASRNALAAVSRFAPPPEASVLGTYERTGRLWAALVNGVGVHVEDFDDTCFPSVLHPGAPVVPAALAVAELIGATGRSLLDAVIVGAEVGIRLADSVAPGHLDRGWHVTGTIGPIAAAAAAGRLLGLDPPRMAAALGIAAVQGAGLQEALGTMTKSLHAGRAAANGVEAALLAQDGLSAPADGFEGKRGFAEAMAPSFDREVAVADIGTRWSILRNAFKPYACGIVAHPSIDAAVAFRDVVADAVSIASITARVHPLVLVAMGKTDPQSGLESKFSIFHAIAVGFLDGVAGPAQFSDTRAREAVTRSLRAKIAIETDPTVRMDEAYVEVATTDGRRFSRHVEHATGSAACPMTDAQLREKAHLVAGPVLGEDGVVQLCDAAFAIDDVAAQVLVNATRPDARRRNAT